jgi:type I pantothenate kinase
MLSVLSDCLREWGAYHDQDFEVNQNPLDPRVVAHSLQMNQPTSLDGMSRVGLVITQLPQLAAHIAGDIQKRHTAEQPVQLFFITGPVASGKTTFAGLLTQNLQDLGLKPHVVSTDGFLYPNATLREKEIFHQKGFPQSYDQEALNQFIQHVKTKGVDGSIRYPTYSHTTKDVGQLQSLPKDANVLIVEGLHLAAFFQEDLGQMLVVHPKNYEVNLGYYLERCLGHIDRYLEAKKSNNIIILNELSAWATYATLPREERIARLTQIFKDVNWKNYQEHMEAVEASACASGLGYFATVGENHEVVSCAIGRDPR